MVVLYGPFVHFILTPDKNSATLARVKSDITSFDDAIKAHDEAVAACGPAVWIGSEPTFTNRFSESPEWLSEALGEKKQAYARRILERLREQHPDALVLRTLGRQYAEEQRPRWSLGLYQRHDGASLSQAVPPDPLTGACTCDAERMQVFWRELVAALEQQGWPAAGFKTDGELGLRVLFRLDGRRPEADPQRDSRLARPSLHEHPIPLTGAVDKLAREGSYLVALGCAPVDEQDRRLPCLELPAFADVASFQRFVQLVGAAAKQAGLSALVWRGFPPPVDASVAWTTLTPDPAVLEINSAPATNTGQFLSMSRLLYGMAQAEGLWPYRLQYNGGLSDSGGGGQFTLGGPSPETSPFFVNPQLLPRLIRYLNHHPALSYWFAPSYLGSHSQSPRPDENVRESFSELAVALHQFDIRKHPDPEFIWRSLSPFLVDTSGNSHRSELNIEKLWNPYLPGRGCLGLVEFRAFRMPRDPQRAAAIAALLRAIVAMLSKRDVTPGLIEWGSQLHDRFALPFHLRLDLEAVFTDLAQAGLGLGEPITQRLLADSGRHIGQLEFDGCRLEVNQAFEFWPLLGDAASQEGGSSRLVDASTSRLQLSLRLMDGEVGDLADWRLAVGTYRIPLRQEQDRAGTVGVMGLRYRSFVPWIGLHPGLEAQGPIVLSLVSPKSAQALRITLHEWQPQALPYDGLPESLEEAERRRVERFEVERISLDELAETQLPPNAAVSDYCLDLRRV
jgi:uncharacterized protein (DUF2126 family)